MAQARDPGQDSEPDSEEQAPLEAGSEQEMNTADAAADAGTDLEAPESEVTEADADEHEVEVSQLKDQVLRSLAEVENVKRRAARDVENAHKFATEKLINDLFPVIDSLEKAVETAVSIEGAESISEGVALSLKLFVDTLGKSGVKQIDPLGEPFDPQLHEAMTMVPNPDAEPNSVMDVMAKGYVLNGRLVRAAKVIVVKGD